MFEVKVVSLIIEPHNNADALEIAQVGDYQCIVRKGQFKTGDLAAYIPEQSIVPDELLEKMGLTGKLAGGAKNRVKAIKLRGVLSQGLCLESDPSWVLDQDVAEVLGIVKYEGEIPIELAGNVWYATRQRTLSYDIPNIKANPHVLEPGEIVVMSEKVHGSCFICGAVTTPDEIEGDIVVQSKGLGGKGLALKINDPVNAHNLYVRASVDHGLHDILRLERDERQMPVYVLGEVFGKGVQDLSYGADNSVKVQGFRLFDIFVGAPTEKTSRFLNDDEIEAFCARHNVTRVPVLYKGPYSKEIMLTLTNGKETVSGKETHIREGLVVKPVVEREDHGRRVQFKSVSEAYLLRKNATEHT